MSPVILLGRLFAAFRRLPEALWIWECRLKGVRVGNNVMMVGRPIVSVFPDSEIHLANKSRILSSLRSNPLGCFQPCVLRTIGAGAVLKLGSHVGMSGCVVIAAESVIIGEETIIGSGAMILDNDFHLPTGEFGWTFDYGKTSRPVTIGRGVFIGARAIILKGVTIGDRAVIGAGAVVTRDVPAHSLATGNPALVRSEAANILKQCDNRDSIDPTAQA